MSLSKSQVDSVIEWLKSWQESISHLITKHDPEAQLTKDNWSHAEKGGGQSRVLASDGLIEQGGANFSHIFGQSLPVAATKARPHLTGCPFQATGVSTVIHPNSPMIPTTHANLRLFVSEPKTHADDGPTWWFGGGFDLTPYYGFDEDCILWHQCAKDACNQLGPDVYDRYKTWCDDYFTLPHRNEQRGIGGIFFDDLYEPGFDECFAFLQAVGNAFVTAYDKICEKRCQLPYTAEQKAFQLYRRGRYVEFNLLYDRGTLFGLQSGGRTESILMSMPPNVNWRYNWQPEPGSEEARLTEYFIKPKDWLVAA